MSQENTVLGHTFEPCGSHLRREDIRPGVVLNGVIPDQGVTVIAALPTEESLTIVYRASDGSLGEEVVDMSSYTARI